MADMRVFSKINSVGRNPNSTVGLRGTPDGSAFVADWVTALALEGRVFIASDADANDTVTGQTSFADTTPTFLLSVPSGTTAIPLFVSLGQSGSVAGAAIDVIIEIDNAERYASGGTSETILSSRTDQPITPACTLRSGATATTAYYGTRVYGRTIGQDVSPAEGAVNGILWRPEAPMFLVGPANLVVYTYAGTTGPTWLWSIGWAEVLTATTITA